MCNTNQMHLYEIVLHNFTWIWLATLWWFMHMQVFTDLLVCFRPFSAAFLTFISLLTSQPQNHLTATMTTDTRCQYLSGGKNCLQQELVTNGTACVMVLWHIAVDLSLATQGIMRAKWTGSWIHWTFSWNGLMSLGCDQYTHCLPSICNASLASSFTSRGLHVSH